MPMNILVTGGAGYIGSHVVVELCAAGFNPIIIDNFCNSNISVMGGLKKIIGKDIKLYTGDCRDLSLMEKIFEQEQEKQGQEG